MRKKSIRERGEKPETRKRDKRERDQREGGGVFILSKKVGKNTVPA